VTAALAGIIPALDEATYHAHPALSSSKARDLLKMPPAKAKHKWSQPEEAKAAFDLGTAVHSKVLGVGAPTVAIPESVLSSSGSVGTNAAREFIANARAAGQTPVKAAVAEQVYAMAEAVLAHPLARFLFEQPGTPEASVFSTDPDTEVELRARFDFLPGADAKRRIGVDLKTTEDASRAEFGKTAAKWRYDVQRGHYLDTYEYAGGQLEGFAFVLVEKAAPHLVAVRPLAPDFEQMGVEDARRARRIYRTCLDLGPAGWPGYATDFEDVMPPFWLIAEFQENLI
jgi:hypothetical protein